MQKYFCKFCLKKQFTFNIMLFNKGNKNKQKMFKNTNKQSF